MANPWDNDQIVTPAGQAAPKPWETDAIVTPAQSDGPWLRNAQPTFSQLRDAGMIQRTPGNEDLWTPSSPPEERPALNPVAGIARELVEGIPVAGPLYTGAIDHIGSNVIGGVTGENPAALREGYQNRLEGFREEHPYLSTGAQIVGGTAAMAPLAATPVGQTAFGMTGPLWQRLATGGLTGAGIGAGDAAVRGEDPRMGALYGAGFGAVGGAAAPHIARFLAAGGRAASALARNVAGAPVPATADYSRPALDAVSRVIDADGAFANSGVLNIARGGPDAMLADVGPGAQSLLDTAIQRSGPGARSAMEAIEQRAATANQTVNRALDDALGAPQGAQSFQTALREGTAPMRHAAYDAAYAAPIDYSSNAGRAIEQMMKRVPENVIQTANRMMMMEGHQSAQILADVGEDGLVTFFRMPDVRQIDYITRALNQAARSGEGQGALGGQTDIGRIYSTLAQNLRDAARTAVPQYDAALTTAAQPIQIREALLFGRNAMSSSVTRDQVSEFVGGILGPQRQAAMAGVRGHIDDVLANVRAVMSDPNSDAREARKALQDLSSRAAREKMELIIGDEAVSQSLFQQLDQAAAALQLRAGVSGNSRTYARTAMDQIVGQQFNQGILNQLMQGRPVNAGQMAIQNLTGRTPQGITALQDQTYEEIARLLTTPRGDQAISMLSVLGNRNAMPTPSAPFVPGLAHGISGNISQ